MEVKWSYQGHMHPRLTEVQRNSLTFKETLKELNFFSLEKRKPWTVVMMTILTVFEAAK